MDDEKQRGWKRFRRLSFDSKKITKRVKRAEGSTLRHANKFLVGRLDNIRRVRRHVISWLLLIALLIVATGVQYMWFRESYQLSASANGGTYAEGSLGPIETLNPLFASSSAEITASRLIFSSLYTYDSTGHLKGDLATSINASEDAKTYTVTLRPDAHWHDGTLLTANDVVFTINLIKNQETRSPLRLTWRDVNIKALDDTTLEFTLPAVYAAFPYALTFAVLPTHILKDVTPGSIRENTYSRSPVGSGPFEFASLQTAESGVRHRIASLSANTKYHGGAARLGRFEIHAYESQDDIIRALKTGEVSGATDVTKDAVLEADPYTYDVVSQPISSGVYSLFNTVSPILKDVAVRKALQVGTDVAGVRQAVAAEVQPLSLPLVNGQLGTEGAPQPVVFDKVKAEAMLDQAGWVMKDGVRTKDEQKLVLSVVTTKNSHHERAVEALASQWRQLGIIVNIVVVNVSDPSTNFVQDTLQARNYDVLLYELFVGADPDVYAYWHSSQTVIKGYNFSNYSNKTVDNALASARARLEPDLRAAKYKTFIAQWIEDVPAIGLYQPVADYAHNKGTRAVDPTSHLVSSYDRFSNILDWSVNEKSVYKTP